MAAVSALPYAPPVNHRGRIREWHLPTLMFCVNIKQDER